MKPYQDEHGKNIIAEKEGVLLAVDDIDNPTYFSLWVDGNKIGRMYISGKNKHPETKELYRKIDMVRIIPKFRGQGLGVWLYRQVLGAIPPEYKGLYSYLPMVVNKKEIPAIQKRLNGKVVNGDHLFIDKPTLVEMVLNDYLDTID